MSFKLAIKMRQKETQQPEICTLSYPSISFNKMKQKQIEIDVKCEEEEYHKY
jgi:hypothetical protein